MATNKPRITISLDPDHYAVLAEMAKLVKSPMSAIVSEIVGEAVPVFTRVVKLIREANALKGEVGERVKGLAEEAELQMLPLAREAVKTLDMFDDAVMEAIRKARESEADGAGGAPGATAAPSAAKGRKRSGGDK